MPPPTRLSSAYQFQLRSVEQETEIEPATFSLARVRDSAQCGVFRGHFGARRGSEAATLIEIALGQLAAVLAQPRGRSVRL
jgi:hypothetical protein